jgi:hypothetical protein
MARVGVVVAAVLSLLVAWGAAMPAVAASPARYCHRAETDDALRPIPLRLVPVARRIFGLARMPARQLRRSTYFRCAGGEAWLCTVGANLACGKADRRRAIPAADRWCAENSGADAVPAYVTGHDTIYRWRCDGARAETVGAVLHVDPRGFVAENWRRAE